MYRGLALLLLVVVGLLALEEIRCDISVEVAFERATDDMCGRQLPLARVKGSGRRPLINLPRFAGGGDSGLIDQPHGQVHP